MARPNHEYTIVIPSHNRPQLIATHTLNVLNRLMSNSGQEIHIYATPNKYDYEYLVQIFPKLNIHVFNGWPGLVHQRNNIKRSYPHGHNLLWLDDDILDINIKSRLYTTLKDEIEHTFPRMRAYNLWLCGVYPSRNYNWNSYCYSLDGYMLAVGFMYFERNDTTLMLPDLFDGEKEDYIRTCQHIVKYGHVQRNNDIYCNHRGYLKASGGMANYDQRVINNGLAVQYLLDKYPEIVGPKNRVRNGISYPEIYFSQKAMCGFQRIEVSKRKTCNPGQYYDIDRSTRIMKGPCVILDKDEGRPIAYIIRDVLQDCLPDDECYKFFDKIASYRNMNRGDISGPLAIDKLRPFEKKAIEQAGGIKLNETGTRLTGILSYDRCNIFPSYTLGYQTTAHNTEDEKKKLSTEDVKNPELIENHVKPWLEHMSAIYLGYDNSYSVNEHGNKNFYGYLDTVFSNLTINKSSRSACHTDKHNGNRACIFGLLRNRNPKCEAVESDLLFPQYGIACGLRPERDLVIFDSLNVMHCAPEHRFVNPLVAEKYKKGERIISDRLSFVCFGKS